MEPPLGFIFCQIDSGQDANGGRWGKTWGACGLRWTVTDVAPNNAGDYLLSDQTLAHERIYDPTNGTISGGGLGRSNLGQIPL